MSSASQGTLRVLVTRPIAQGRDYADQLREAGLQADCLPLIAIEPMADSSIVRDAAARLPQFDAVVFVSPNAVQQFFNQGMGSLNDWPQDMPVAALGPGTLQALAQLGVPQARITAPAAFGASVDSEALWVQLSERAWAGRRVMIVRGDGGRDWLADQLRQAGAEVVFVQAYRRTPPQWDPAQQHLFHQALVSPDVHLWLFSSSQSIDHLEQLLPEHFDGWSGAAALTTHPRIADRARRSGFGRVQVSAPDLTSLIACIQSVSW